LFSDVALPGGMTGAEVAAKARQLRPLKVLFTIGYQAGHLVRGCTGGLLHGIQSGVEFGRGHEGNPG
jgi:CheY-like chemotaxis protein